MISVEALICWVQSWVFLGANGLQWPEPLTGQTKFLLRLTLLLAGHSLLDRKLQTLPLPRKKVHSCVLAGWDHSGFLAPEDQGQRWDRWSQLWCAHPHGPLCLSTILQQTQAFANNWAFMQASSLTRVNLSFSVDFWSREILPGGELLPCSAKSCCLWTPKS